MSTSIKSTELDFQEIKESLKDFLKKTGEFNDYDFDGSGLNSILDVLAYNTHMNALQTNFALNESFLVTAQLRPSVVSLAESLGYVPDSRKSSEVAVNVTLTAPANVDLPESSVLSPGQLRIRGERDAIDYTFSNRVTLKAVATGNVYQYFPTSNPEDPIIMYEGENKVSQFIVSNSSDDVYVIPDKEIDISTAIVRVYQDQNSATTEGGEFSTYTSLLDASTVSSLSRLYILRESPNGYYELSFGNGTSLGIAPTPGNVVEVDYLRSSGSAANQITDWTTISSIRLGTSDIDPQLVNVSASASGSQEIGSNSGGDKEGIESIRKNAPFQFAAQNRMVTSDDHSTLILKKYSNFISDIQSWGGEDNPEPDYGSVFTSIVWKENLTGATRTNIRQGILSLSDQFQVASFRLVFVDPVETYISTVVFYQFNPALSGASPATVRENVADSVEKYFLSNTGKFSQTFRRSNLLTAIDETDPSVLSSRLSIKLSRRVIPELSTTRNYSIEFPSAILRPENSQTVPAITSSEFIYDNKTVRLRNKLDKKILVSDEGEEPKVYNTVATTELEMFEVSTGETVEGKDDVGYYLPQTGKVFLESLRVDGLVNSGYFEIFCVPANQSVVESKLNNILRYDAGSSSVNAVFVDTN